MQGSLFADSTQGPCYSSLLLWGCCCLTLGLRLTPRTPELWEEIPKQVTAFCLMPAVHSSLPRLGDLLGLASGFVRTTSSLSPFGFLSRARDGASQGA